MSSGDHQKWLYSGDQGRNDPFSSLEWAVSGSPYTDELEEETLPKDYEAIRSWLEYAKTKTWLVDDKSTTLSALPREHQVAVPLPRGEVEKWLVRPTTDALAGQLQTKLVLSSENYPWLMSRAPKHDGNAITAHFSAVLSSPSSQWLCKRSSRSDDLTKWLLEPKKARSTPTSSLDPLSSWKTYQAGIEWLASPFNPEHVQGIHDPASDLEVDDDSSGEEDNLLAFSSAAPTSLPLPFSNHQQMGVDIEKWLLPSGPFMHLTHPLLGQTKPEGATETLDQWLCPSQSRPTFDQGSEASLITLGSEYELIDEL